MNEKEPTSLPEKTPKMSQKERAELARESLAQSSSFLADIEKDGKELIFYPPHAERLEFARRLKAGISDAALAGDKEKIRQNISFLEELKETFARQNSQENIIYLQNKMMGESWINFNKLRNKMVQTFQRSPTAKMYSKVSIVNDGFLARLSYWKDQSQQGQSFSLEDRKQFGDLFKELERVSGFSLEELQNYLETVGQEQEE